MFVTKSDIQDLSQKIEKISRQLEQITAEQLQQKDADSKKIDTIMDMVGKIQASLDDQKNQKQDLSSQYRAAIAQIKHFNEHYDRLLNTFKMLEQDTQNRLFEHASSEMNTALEKFRHSARQYGQIEEHMLTLKKKIRNIESAIDRFISISREIKEKDFTLDRHFKNMHSQDKEKLELLKQNEKLKQLIAKERRRRR